MASRAGRTLAMTLEPLDLQALLAEPRIAWPRGSPSDVTAAMTMRGSRFSSGSPRAQRAGGARPSRDTPLDSQAAASADLADASRVLDRPAPVQRDAPRVHTSPPRSNVFVLLPVIYV